MDIFVNNLPKDGLYGKNKQFDVLKYLPTEIKKYLSYNSTQ